MVHSLLPRLGSLPLLAVIILLLAGGGVATVTADLSGQQSPPDVDNTVTRIELYENNSARWTVQIRTRLDTAQRVDEYEAFQARFEQNTSHYLNPFRSRIRNVVANAAAATGREMRAEDFSATTSMQEVPRRWGIVTYEFTWTNFADRTDDTLVLGDVFEGGFFLAANDTLIITAPTHYGIEHVAPEPTSQAPGTVEWVGREDFPHHHPQVRFVPQAGGATITSSPTPSAGGSLIIGVGPGSLVGGGLLLLLVLGIGYGVHRRRTESSLDKGRSEPQVDASDDQTTGVVMTDEERVRKLLEARGGRIRQAVIADELGWSASKTSRVIGQMADAGSVEKLQLGRENLLKLVDQEE